MEEGGQRGRKAAIGKSTGVKLKKKSKSQGGKQERV